MMTDPTCLHHMEEDDEKLWCSTEQQPLRLPSRTVVPRSIPELLWQREVAGTRSQHHHERVARHRKQFFGDLAPSAEQLSSTIAWNASRMQNMILAVGPGTPASLLMSDHHVRDSSSSTQSESDDDDDDEEEEADDDDDDDDDDQLVEDEHDGGVEWQVVANAEEKEAGGVAPRHTLRSRTQQDDTASEPDHGSTEHVQSQQQQQSQLLPWMASRNERYAPAPSMRHGGCINTATWLTSPWRLSTVSYSGPHGILSSSYSSNPESAMSATTSSIQTVASNECPTQLLTSGDDRVVKIWDVSMAMGTSNPLYGGTATVCPFSAPMPRWSSDVARKRWKSYYVKRMTTTTTASSSSTPSMQIAGSVIPLLTLSTGHRANIFHVTPLDWQMGKVATCGADGFLRLSDIVSETNSVVVSPEYDESPGGAAAALMGFFNLHTNMCFSHVFLNANTGLLCSERGLKRFDIRLSPREQPTQNLLGNTASSSGSGSYHRSMSSSCCKACAVYSYSSLDGGSDDESAYVFAGGSSATVSLYDLRMTAGDDSSSRVIERYRPKSLNRDTLVSVSGLDISKDRRELLVSYENDQIYTFPIFPKASSAAGPSLDEIQAQTDSVGDSLDTVVPELCSYGAHLNRFTFLKNAKYAGPKDDYICTGSDSGRAWIYERSSGAVVSLLNADRSTCNGVVPHPSLPFFITYGIDSTAKLWRATLPVDSNVDDSAVGRAKCFQHRPYEMSPLARNWEAVQGFLDSAEGMAGGEPISIFPDQVPHSKEMVHRGRMGRAFLLSPDTGNTQIGNDLHNLPQLLRQNAFACLRALRDDDDEPVRSGFGPLKRRLSAIRLRHQADQNGLLWNRSIPWLFASKRHICTSKATASSPSSAQMETSSTSSSSTSSTLTPYGDLVDLVPDNPSDWIPFDPLMSKEPFPCGTPFNLDDYEDVMDRYRSPRGCIDHNVAQPPTCSWKRAPSPDNLPIPRPKQEDDEIELANGSSDGNHPKSDDSTKQDTESSAQGKEALRILCETATLLKEGGNVALQAGNAHLAASRYDKALQYCAVAFMDFPSCNLTFRDDPVRQSWSPLLKVLISTRLNLSMCLLRPEIAQPQRAIDQAQLALKELKRFSTRKPAAANGEAEELSANEPDATYQEARELQAKAYFRLGSAQYDLGDYAASCKSFEQSAKITKATSKTAQPDKVIMRRLAEAKRENARQSKRQKKMFKFMFSGHDPDEATPNTADNDKKASAVASAEATTITTSTDEDHNVAPSGEEGKEEPSKSADEEMESSNEVATSSEMANSNEVATSSDLATSSEVATSSEMASNEVATSSELAGSTDVAHSNDE